ncbi:Ig-like domain-containing protein [Methanosarcina sp.]|uniref:Ig-like domain-containing protein n=1 Tax=Methanosarcina sp. TaxID=2213 RepID=UPI003BB4D158
MLIRKLVPALILYMLIICILLPFNNIASATESCSKSTEWNPSNVVNIQSGGSSNLLKSPEKKMAIQYTAATSKNITEIMLLPGCYFPEENQPVWSVGIQADNDKKPDGRYLGKGTLTNAKDRVWSTIKLAKEVKVVKGDTYWIVIEYLSGPIPTKENNWIGFYASQPTQDFMSENIPLPYNYGGEDKSVNDMIAYTNVKYYDGTLWKNDPNGRNLPAFILKFNDNTYHGQPYMHNYFRIYGKNMTGQIYVNHINNKTVNVLQMPWNVFHDDNVSAKPKGNLYYYIRENNYNGKLISNGIFLRPEEVYVSGISNGAGDRRWYSVKLNQSITFEKDKTYFMYFSSPNSNISVHWGSDAPNAFAESANDSKPLSSTTFDGTSSYFMKTDTGDWSNNRKFLSRDLSFRFFFENAPVIITSFEPANKSVFNEGQRIKISLNASDADNQTLNYTIKIDGVMCSKSSSCIWNTSYSSSGNHTIEVTASDGIEVVKKINTIYINDYHPRWDVNEDGVVDFLDINIIAQNYGTIPKAPYPDWDVNQDGVINLGDLLLAESHFGEKVV